MDRTPLAKFKNTKMTMVWNDEDRVPYGYVGFFFNGIRVMMVKEEDLFDRNENRFDLDDED